jgi:type I restriction enzyme S subunit
VPDNLDRAVAGYDMVVAMTGGHGRFMAWQLLSAIVRDYQFLLYRLRAAQPHLNAEQLGRTLVLLPPEDEQQVVAHHLDREMAKIEALVAKVRAHIERLAELRAALVSAAVTGKIDVREQTP